LDILISTVITGISYKGLKPALFLLSEFARLYTKNSNIKFTGVSLITSLERIFLITMKARITFISTAPTAIRARQAAGTIGNVSDHPINLKITIRYLMWPDFINVKKLRQTRSNPLK
jgi:hypothetical protein